MDRGGEGSPTQKNQLEPFLVVSVFALEFCEAKTYRLLFKSKNVCTNKLFHSETPPLSTQVDIDVIQVINGPGLPPPLLHTVKGSKARQAWE